MIVHPSFQLGNTVPGDHIVIRFAYFQMLFRLGEGLSLRIPFCPGIRYIPGKPLLRKNRGLGTVDDTDQVPDASRITPPRIVKARAGRRRGGSTHAWPLTATGAIWRAGEQPGSGVTWRRSSFGWH